jgi:hypothetical protein
MRILLINNNTVHLKSLLSGLNGHQFEIQKYRPGLDFHDAGKDLVVLSGGGGEGLEIHDEHRFEVIARAYGAPVTDDRGLVLGREQVQVSRQAKRLWGSTLSQHEAHSWRVQDVPSDFEVLATSKTGIEIFRYDDPQKADKTIFATQFHPEKGGTLQISQLLASY